MASFSLQLTQKSTNFPTSFPNKILQVKPLFALWKIGLKTIPFTFLPLFTVKMAAGGLNHVKNALD